MIYLTVALTVVLLLNSLVWLGISILIFYNLHDYTVNKRELRKDLPPFLRKYL